MFKLPYLREEAGGAPGLESGLGKIQWGEPLPWQAELELESVCLAFALQLYSGGCTVYYPRLAEFTSQRTVNVSTD